MSHSTPRTRVLTATLAVALPLLAAAPTVPALAAPPKLPKITKCFGKKPTMVVTGKKAKLTLPPSAKNAVVELLGPGESLSAARTRAAVLVCDLGGAASIVTGNGADRVSINDGSPTVTTGGGNDTFTQTGTGNPKVHLGAGNDTATLARGNGTVFGDDGNDILRAGRAATGRGGRQHLTGGRGSDLLVSGAAASTLDGSDGGNVFTVAARDAAHTTLILHAGDRVNGVVFGATGATGATGAPAPTPDPAPAPVQAPAPALVPPPTGAIVSTVKGQGASQVPTSGLTELDLAAVPATGHQLTGWSLDFGDGAPPHSGLGLPPTEVGHTYTTPGAYTAALTLTDDLNRSTVAATTPISAGGDPDASFVASVSGATVSGSFSGGPGAGSGYAKTTVDYGDGTVTSYPGKPTIQHAYAAGHYRISVTVANDHGGAKSSGQSVNVTDSTGHASLVFTGFSGITGKGPGYTTVGTNALFIDAGRSVGAGTKPISGETLDAGDGTGAASASYSQPTYKSPGTKTVTLSFTSGGASYTSTDKVYVASAAAQAATIDNLPSTATVGKPVSFTTTATPGAAPSGAPHQDALVSRTLTFTSASDDGSPVDAGSVATTAPVTHTFTAPGVYTVEADARDSYGDVHSAYTTITVTSGGPSIQRFADGNSATSPWLGHPLDQTLSFELVAVGGPGHATDGHYSLDYGDGTPPAVGGFDSDASAGPSAHTYAKAGEFSAILTVTDGSGAVTSAATHVSVTAPPTVSLAGTPTSSGAGLTVTMASRSYAAGTVGDHWTVSVGGSDDSIYTMTGNGPVPGSVTFAPGAYGGTAPYSANVRIYDDHGGQAMDAKQP